MNPIRRRPCADPVQKHVPGEWITQKGIDSSRPVTEARMEPTGRRKAPPMTGSAKSGSGGEGGPGLRCAPSELRDPCAPRNDDRGGRRAWLQGAFSLSPNAGNPAKL